MLIGTQKIFGCNNPSLIKRAISRSSVSDMFEENDLYFNTIQTVLIKTGIIGLVIFLLFLFDIYHHNLNFGKIVVVTFLGYSLLASLFFTDIMMLYLVLAFSLKKNKYVNKIMI